MSNGRIRSFLATQEIFLAHRIGALCDWWAHSAALRLKALQKYIAKG